MPSGGDVFDQIHAQVSAQPQAAPQQPLSFLGKLRQAVVGGVEDTASQYPQALKAGVQAIGAGVAPMAKAAVQPLRNIAAFGERTIGEAATGQEYDPDSQSQAGQQAAALEQPIQGAATGWQGAVAQAPAQLGSMLVSPEIAAAQQLQQGGQITPANAVNAGMTEAFGRGLTAPLANAAEGIMPQGGRIVNAGLNAGAAAGANLLSGQNAANGIIPNTLMGALAGGEKPEAEAPAPEAAPVKPTPEQHQQIRDAVANHPLVKGYQEANQSMRDQLAAQPPAPAPRPAPAPESDVFSQIEAERAARKALPRGEQPAETPAPAETPQQKAQTRLQQMLAQAPKFTEGTAAPTEPGEIGYRNREAPEVAEEKPVDQNVNTSEQVPTNRNPLFETTAERQARKIADIESRENQKSNFDKQIDSALAEGDARLADENAKQNSLPNALRRRTGAVQVPQVVTDQLEAMGQRGDVKEGLRRMTASTENDVHTAVSSMKPYTELADKYLDTPEKEANWIDTVEKTGQSPIPELQPLADLNRKMNEAFLGRRSSLGEDVDDLNPNHIRFLAQPTDRTPTLFGQSGGLAGSEGFMHKRESEGWQDFNNRIQKAGLERPYKNIAEMMMAGHAEQAKSLAGREMVNDWLDKGFAKQLPKGASVPDGMLKLPDALASDPLINPKQESIVLPEAAAKTIEHYWKNKRGSDNLGGLLKAVNATASATRYATDTIYASRAISSSVGDTLGMMMRGNAKGNIVNAFLRGRKLLQSSVESLRSDPATAPLADWLEKSQKEGGLRSGELAKLPTPDAERGTMKDFWKQGPVKVMKSLQRYISEPLKVGWANIAAEYAGQKRSSGDWSHEEAQSFSQRYIKALDDQFGHAGGVRASHPGLSDLADIAYPLWRYHTSGLRSGARALGEAATGVGKSTLPEFAGQLIAHLGLGLGAGMAISKAMTGSAIPPSSALDFFFPKTGEKNEDGTPKRLAIPGLFTPLAEEVVRASKGTESKQLGAMLNPEIESISESIMNRDWKGDLVGNDTQRWIHGLGGFMPMIPRDNGTEGVDWKAFAGLKTAPQDVGRSKAMEVAHTLMQQSRGPRTPEQQDKAQLKSALLQDLRQRNLQPIKDAMKSGEVSSNDVVGIIKDMNESSGLPGLLTHISDPNQLQQVWDAASGEERSELKPVLIQHFLHTKEPAKWVGLLKAIKQDSQ
jgi:hypothetical protein